MHRHSMQLAGHFENWVNFLLNLSQYYKMLNDWVTNRHPELSLQMLPSDKYSTLAKLGNNFLIVFIIEFVLTSGEGRCNTPPPHGHMPYVKWEKFIWILFLAGTQWPPVSEVYLRIGYRYLIYLIYFIIFYIPDWL